MAHAVGRDRRLDRGRRGRARAGARALDAPTRTTGAATRAAEMLAAIDDEVADGAIVLAHDALGPGATRSGCAETVALIAPLVALARDRGLEPVTLAAALPGGGLPVTATGSAPPPLLAALDAVADGAAARDHDPRGCFPTEAVVALERAGAFAPPAAGRLRRRAGAAAHGRARRPRRRADPRRPPQRGRAPARARRAGPARAGAGGDRGGHAARRRLGRRPGPGRGRGLPRGHRRAT